MTSFYRNLLLVLLVAVGILLRCWDLGNPILFRDEAESAINALTILDHGVPTDRYLNLPIFENTLTRPWPENPEYEFKDTSYSDRGLAVYHGWLPLYAMAASFAIFGIAPDQPSDRLQVRHGPEEMYRRTVAARAPSIVFAVIFLVSLYVAGRAFYGVNAGILALTFGSFTPYLIWASRQARYYSATLAIGTLCMVCIWLVARNGRWRDFVSAGVLLVLLFHSHVMSFAALVVVLGLTLPVVLKRPGAGLKVATLGTIMTVGIVPWVWLTGFLDASRRVPMAYSLLSFPEDLLLYHRQHPGVLALIMGVVVELGVVLLLREKLPLWVVEPFRRGGAAIVFLLGVLCLSNFLFLFLTPAASFFLGRMTLLLAVPAVLLAAVLLTANAWVVSPRNPGMVLAVLVFVGLTLSWRVWLPQSQTEASRFFEVADYLRSQNLHAGTRIYALPYDHFPLIFYTGLPVQSIAPVRREFLDGYKDDILIVDRGIEFPSMSADVLRRHALDAGEDLGVEALQTWQYELSTRPTREHLANRVKEVDPPLKPLPLWAELALEQQRSELEATSGHEDFGDENPAIFRGYHVTDWVRFWPVFFYRFIGPEQRSGPYLNYASRIRSAQAVVLSSSWVIYYCNAPIRSSSVAGRSEKGGEL